MRNPRRGLQNPRLGFPYMVRLTVFVFSGTPLYGHPGLITTPRSPSPVYNGQFRYFRWKAHESFLKLPRLMRTPVKYWQRTLLCPVSQTRIVNPVWWTLVTYVHLLSFLKQLCTCVPFSSYDGFRWNNTILLHTNQHKTNKQNNKTSTK